MNIPAGIISAPWGKTNRRELESTDFAWLSLTSHSIDVAITLRQLLQARTLARLEAAAGRKLGWSDLDRLCVLALYHDAGKACAAFQNKIVQQLQAGYSGHTGQLLALSAGLRSRAGIVPAGYSIVDALELEELETWFWDPDGLLDAISLVASHHGGVAATPGSAPLLGADAATVFGHDPAAGLAELADVGRRLFPEAWRETQSLPDRASFWHGFLGLLMLADWIGSDARQFPLTGAEEVQGRSARAKQAASALLSSVGFHQPLPREHPDAVPVLLKGRSPRPLQVAVAEVPLDERLLVIEAPTGEGKTEAALIRFIALLRAGEVDGLYFALPTRAAGKEIHGRVQDALRRLWPGVDLPPVILAQGGERDDRDQHDESPAPPWASEDSRRFLAAGVAVGTVDQALLSVLRVRYAHIRGAALMRSLLVIDEVHASDPYMAELMAHLVRRHIALGGHLVCLSATLGASALAKLTGEAPSAFADARTVPYPAITTGQSKIKLAHDTARERTVAASVVKHQQALQEAIGAADRGARVLWMRSAVDDAISDQRSLLVAGALTLQIQSKSAPHHGRFAPADRPVLDAAILQALGADRPSGGLVVVATQTAEQSLDIDADLMITDACPPDVLLQRLGRLHRHPLRRPPGHENPTLLVIDSGRLDRFLRGAKELPRGEPGHRWPWVYSNLLAVHETLRWIAKGSLRLPIDCRAMVEEGTHPEHLRELADHLGGPWRDLWIALYGRDGALRTEARQVLLDWFRPAMDQPVLTEQVVRSRIGADKLSLATDFVSPFGSDVDRLHVPWRWLEQPIDRAEVTGRDPEGVMLQAGDLRMRYTAVGLEKLT